MNLSAQVPLLSTSKIEVDISNNPQANKKAVESDNEVFFFMPNSPSQRSLMDIQLPDSPTFARVLLMAFFPCFVAPICSPEKRQEFWRVPRTVTFLMCLIQIIMFCIALGLDGFESPQNNWLLGPTGDALVELGAKQGPLMRYDYEIWRYFTPIFLHAGIIELVINIFGQMRMGLYLERKWKWYIFVCIYVLSGIGGIALSCDAQPNIISVAASASFMGVMGAYCAEIQLTWFKMEGWQKRMNLSVCLSFIIITFLEGLGHNYVDSFAHLGGLAIGLIQGYSLFGLQYARRWNPRKARAIPGIGIICLLAYFIITVSLFYTIVPVNEDTYAVN